MTVLGRCVRFNGIVAYCVLALCVLRTALKTPEYCVPKRGVSPPFDNRPGTGRFLRISLAWSHIVPAPSGVCIWKHRPVPGRAPYDIVRCPDGVVKDQPDTVRCRPILHEFSRAFIHTFISNLAIIPKKKQVVKIRKVETDSDSDCDENHTCSKQQKFK